MNILSVVKDGLHCVSGEFPSNPQLSRKNVYVFYYFVTIVMLFTFFFLSVRAIKNDYSL